VFNFRRPKDGYVCIDTFSQVFDAEFVRTILEERGIGARVEQSPDPYGRFHVTVPRFGLFVAGEQVEAAQAILEEVAAEVEAEMAQRPAEDEVIEVEAVPLPPRQGIVDAPEKEYPVCEQCGSEEVHVTHPPRWPMLVLAATLVCSPLFFKMGPMGRFGWFFLVLMCGLSFFRSSKAGLHCARCGWNNGENPQP